MNYLTVCKCNYIERRIQGLTLAVWCDTSVISDDKSGI